MTPARPDCGCCAGTQPLTPAPTTNPPGLATLTYRVGTHGAFLETMLARLSNHRLTDSCHQPLRALTARSGDDASIALLDAWATLADVLTFYQERIANEGYLRTATERRSLLELARLVGYQPRPGVAASTWLAYTLDVATNARVTIPAGSRAQSMPGPGQLPQPFETATDLDARAAWNTLRPRQTRPTNLSRLGATLYVTGITSGLKPNDRLLLQPGDPPPPVVRRVASVTPDPAAGRTAVALQSLSPATALPSGPPFSAGAGEDLALLALEQIFTPLLKPPSTPPADPANLGSTPATVLGPGSDVAPQLLTALHPELASDLYRAWATVPTAQLPAPDAVQALRVRAAPFGATAPLQPVRNAAGAQIDTEEWPLAGSVSLRVRIHNVDSPGSVDLEIVKGDQVSGVTTSFENSDYTLNLGKITVCVDQGSRTLEAKFQTPPGSPTMTRTITIKLAGTIIRVSESDANQETPEGPETSSVTIGTGPHQVIFDDDPSVEWAPAAGQTLHQTVDTHRITVELGQDPVQRNISMLTATYEQPLPPNPKILTLDAVYPGILPGSWVVVERPGRQPKTLQINDVATIAMAAYNISATVTQLTLTCEWLYPTDVLLSAVRPVAVYAQSEPLDLVEEPRSDNVAGPVIDLDGLYPGLRTGRSLIVTGERTDLHDQITGAGATGISGTELVMIAGVTQSACSGLSTRTTIALSTPLAYTYKRDTVQIYGNVVRATHGETSSEVLGSGDATKAGQSFTLHRSPLTYLAAATPSGAASTLQVRVEEVRWHEADSVAFLGPTDRAYLTRTGDSGTTTVIFGDGVRGARLPTGAENVTATYRTGIGAAGNVSAGQISQLQSRPLGVNTVTNPLRASGGADRDGPDALRANAPLAVAALDRLVSVPDYANFTRARAGIGKALAQRLSDGIRTLVHVTIAGVGDVPIDPDSDLLTDLRAALVAYGDPSQPVQVAVRELLLLVIAAGVQVGQDYTWALVEPHVRAALLDRFSFAHRDLAQSVVLSEVITAIQGVPGVVRVVVDAFGTVSESAAPTALAGHLGTTLTTPPPPYLPACPARPDTPGGVLPAQLAVLSPTVPDTLILRELTS